MFVHVILLRWLETTSELQVEEILQALREMHGEIPGLSEVLAGVNQSTRSQGYSHGAVMRFESREALEGYATHPVHEAILARLRQKMAQVAVLDFEA